MTKQASESFPKRAVDLAAASSETVGVSELAYVEIDAQAKDAHTRNAQVRNAQVRNAHASQSAPAGSNPSNLSIHLNSDTATNDTYTNNTHTNDAHTNETATNDTHTNDTHTNDTATNDAHTSNTDTSDTNINKAIVPDKATVPDKAIVTDGVSFKDRFERTLILRGVNLGGNSKAPVGQASHVREGFFDHRQVSFVGRPVPLAEADVHFSRLRAWGMRLLRLVITWEAIEHAGPGQYDTDYLDYLQTLVAKAGEFGLFVVIDPHQDVWSRFCGGDGAPGWTLEAAGLNMRHFAETGAAIVHQTHGDPFPKMHWLANYSKLATATMFTLFFAGADFAPKMRIDGVSIQDYLQQHYIDAMCEVAKRLKGMPHVIGYGTLNEPSSGYIGLDDVRKRVHDALLVGDMPTVFESMCLAAGEPQWVQHWTLSSFGPRKRASRLLNRERVAVWLEQDIWQQHGVWQNTASGAKLLRPDYFAKAGGREVDFMRDYFRPFANRYASAIRAVDPEVLLFVEGLPGEESIYWSSEDAPNIVHAPHWYDVATLISKRFLGWLSFDVERGGIVLGHQHIRGMFARQIAKMLRVSREAMLGAPTLIGEVGIPFDMNPQAFQTGDFKPQTRAMQASLRSLERHMVSYTLWNYNPDNNNARGDGWNGEDLSIYSVDQHDHPQEVVVKRPLEPDTLSNDQLTALNQGGRALTAVVRPYAYKIAGQPLGMAFHIKRKIFRFRFRDDANLPVPTEFFVPRYHYPDGYDVVVSDGHTRAFFREQRLLYYPEKRNSEHTLVIYPKNTAKKRGKLSLDVLDLKP